MVENLYQAIRSELLKHAELKKVLGEDDIIVQRLCVKILGMQEAFKIVAGMSYCDYLMSKLSIA